MDVIHLLVDFGIVLAIMLGGSVIASFIVFVLWRLSLRMVNLYYTFEQWMSVRILEAKGIVELDDDRRETVIACLKEYGVPFGDACKFITDINRRLNEKLGKDHTPEA